MSFKLMALAATAKTQTPTQKLILLLLADKANDEGICWPKMKTIAEDACVTRQCVLENVKKLAAQGFINVRKRTIHDEELGHKRNASSIYQVNKHALIEASGDRVNHIYREGGRVNEDYMQGKRGLHPKVNEDDNKNLPLEPINEPIISLPTSASRPVGSGEDKAFDANSPERKKRKTCDDYTPEFNAWWSIYKKGSKKRAFMRWKQEKVTPEQIMDQTEQYIAYCKSVDRPLKDGEGFISGRFFETEWTHEAQGTKPKGSQSVDPKNVNWDII